MIKNIILLILLFNFSILKGQDTLLYENFDKNNKPDGWNCGGKALSQDSDGSNSWQFGEPEGGIGSYNFWIWDIEVGNPDPTKDHTPNNNYNKVVGQGLMDSSKEAGISTYYNDTYEWVQTPKINLKNNNLFILSFYRWANFEKDYDSAFVEISNDNINWKRLNKETFPQDSSWIYKEYIFTKELIGDSSIYIRWSSKSDDFLRHSGWNIDDILIKGYFIKNIKWNGNESSDWSNPLNWTPNIIPDKELNAIIDNSNNNPIITSNINCDSLIIKPNSTLIINGNLNINGNLIIKSNEKGTGSIVENNNIVVNGETIVQQYIIGNKYHYIGTPVKNITNDVVNSKVYYWDEYAARNNWIWGWKSYTGYWKPLQGYNINNSETEIIEFIGELNSGNISIDLTGTDGDEVIEHEGWNLISNPYPSYINWNSINGWIKNNIKDAIYIWNPEIKNYMSYVNGVGTNGGTQYIPPMQGFFVKTENYGNAYIEINNSARISNEKVNFKNEPLNYIILKISNKNYSDETIIRFNSFSNDSFDYDFDAHKKLTYNDVPNIWSEIDETKYSINSLNFENFIEIEIFIKVPNKGKYDIITKNKTPYDNLILKDVEKDSIYHLDKKIKIKIDKTKSFNKFLIKRENNSTKNVEIKKENNIILNLENNVLNISGLNPFIHDKYMIYDIHGRLIHLQKIEKKEYYHNLSKGFFIVNVIGENFNKSFKILN